MCRARTPARAGGSAGAGEAPARTTRERASSSIDPSRSARGARPGGRRSTPLVDVCFHSDVTRAPCHRFSAPSVNSRLLVRLARRERRRLLAARSPRAFARGSVAAMPSTRSRRASKEGVNMLAARCGGVPFPSRSASAVAPSSLPTPDHSRPLVPTTQTGEDGGRAPPSPARACFRGSLDRLLREPFRHAHERPSTPREPRRRRERPAGPRPRAVLPRAGADATSLLHRRLSAGSASVAASRMRLEVSDTFAAPVSPPDDDTLSDAAAPRRSRRRDDIRGDEHPHPRPTRDRVQSQTCAGLPSSVSPRSPRASFGSPRGAISPRRAISPGRASLGSPSPVPVPVPVRLRFRRRRAPSRTPSRDGSARGACRIFAPRRARIRRVARERRRRASRTGLASGRVSRGGGERARCRGIVGEGRERSRDRRGDARGARGDGVGGVSTLARRAMRRVAQSRVGRAILAIGVFDSAWRPNRRGGRRSSGRDARPTAATTRYVASSTPRPPRPREVSSPCPRFS